MWQKSKSVLIVVLLIIAASRFLRLNDTPMHPDEIWSVWQTLGTPDQVLRWTPYDWPPGYFLTLMTWRHFTGIHPVALRLLSALAFLIGAAALYRAARRLHTEWAAVLSTLAYGALGFGTLISIEARGYALLMGMMPLTLWLTLRYFERPRWRRAVPLALSLASMFYISLTSVGAFLAFGLYTIIVYRRAVWRWWLPGVPAGLLALPEILNKARTAVERVEATRTLQPPPLSPALGNLLWHYAGDTVWLWIILLAAAAFLLIRWRSPHAAGLLAWGFALPVLLYVLNPVLGFFSARYAWWVMVGIALLVGIGLSRLPRAGAIGAGLILAASVFYPLPQTGEYRVFQTLSPLGSNFRALRPQMQYGDVILLDPSQNCGAAEEWDYYQRLHFSDSRLTFVQQPGDYRRVWYVYSDGRQNPALEQAVQRNRLPGAFIGPARCLFKLYEAPPNPEGIPFANGMRFHGADVIDDGQTWTGPVALHEGDNLRLRLWWSADAQVDLDYSIGVFILPENRGRVVAESNSAPQTQPPETSRWTPGVYYVEERELTLSPSLSSGDYDIYLAVYHWQNPERVDAPGVNEERLLPLAHLPVKAY